MSHKSHKESGQYGGEGDAGCRCRPKGVLGLMRVGDCVVDRADRDYVLSRCPRKRCL